MEAGAAMLFDVGLLQTLLPESLFSYWLKGTLICLIGLSLGSELSFLPASIRHRIAIGTVFSLAVLPILSVLISPWELPLQARNEGTAVDLSLISATLIPVYLSVVFLLIAKLCVDLIGSTLISRRAQSAGTAAELCPSLGHTRKKIAVRYSSEIATPLAIGWMQPKVLLPSEARNWSHSDIEMTLQHELTHIERSDWLSHLLARCVHALYWPVPGMGALMRQLSLSMEQACDDRVLESGASPADYAAMLLRLARGNRLPATVSLGHGSELGVRIRYLVVEIVDHRVLATGTTMTFVMCALVTAPLATVQIGHRPVLPEPHWGIKGVVDGVIHPAGSVSEDATVVEPPKFKESVLAPLGPGPTQPIRPADVERPPRYKGQEKPSIPPP